MTPINMVTIPIPLFIKRISIILMKKIAIPTTSMMLFVSRALGSNPGSGFLMEFFSGIMSPLSGSVMLILSNMLSEDFFDLESSG